MKKLKVLKAFFDKVEDRYVYPDKEPEIEREEKRALDRPSKNGVSFNRN